MSNHSPLLRILTVSFAISLTLACASSAIAQSGRRVRTPPPAPVPVPEPTPTPKPSPEKPRPAFTFLIGMDRHDGFGSIPLYASDEVLRSLGDRLGDAPSVKVGAAQNEMSRSDAINRAKGEKEAYVVWLQIRRDSMSGDDRDRGTLNNINIEYSVFEPTTAKLTTSGRTYTQTSRNKGGILGRRTSGIYGDRLLIQAAHEAAERIMAHFRIQAPPDKFP